MCSGSSLNPCPDFETTLPRFTLANQNTFTARPEKLCLKTEDQWPVGQAMPEATVSLQCVRVST
jgi:hypothetical protein